MLTGRDVAGDGTDSDIQQVAGGQSARSRTESQNRVNRTGGGSHLRGVIGNDAGVGIHLRRTETGTVNRRGISVREYKRGLSLRGEGRRQQQRDREKKCGIAEIESFS